MKELKFIGAIILGFLFLSWLISLMGCSPTKKNEKAFSRVLSNEDLFQRMGKRWEEVNPCTNDSTTRFIFGEEVTKYDTTHEYHTDTLIDVQTLEKVVTKYSTITKTVKKTDTLKISVVDTRRVNELNKDIANRDGQIQVLTNNVKEEKSNKSKWMWSTILSNAGWILGLIIFIKFKK